jgi:membrane protease YdiL (CAAX protease family)
MKTINRTTLFIAFTFGISYSIAAIYKIAGFDYHDKIAFTLLGAAYMFIPALSAIIVKKLIFHERVASDLRISFRINRWFFAAWLLMPLISFSALGISLLFPDVTFNPEMSGLIKRIEPMMTPEQLKQIKDSIENLPMNPIVLILLQGLVAGATVNAVAAFGEELGWRGFLVYELRDMSFLKATIIIGFIWGTWHAPLILMGHNYPQHPQIGVFMMIILSILLGSLFLYITLKSRSVIAAAIMHGTMNATAGISVMLTNGGNDLTTGMAGLAGILAVTVFLAGLFIYDVFVSRDKIMLNRIGKHLSPYLVNENKKRQEIE